MKYSSFLSIASIWVFTVLCLSAASDPTASSIKAGTDADYFNGNITIVLQELSNIDKSSNILLKNFRDVIAKYLNDFDKDKQKIQYAVNEGTEMEKKIRNILLTLKNAAMPLTTELQSDIKEIEKHAADQLKKLKEVENVEYINVMQKQHKDKFAAVQKRVEDLSKLGIEISKKTAAQRTEANEKDVGETKTKIMEVIKTLVSAAFATKKDIDTISNKMKIAYDAFFNIRDDLIKVEQIEYHLLLSKKNFKTDATSLISSSVAQISFSIMFVILF